jgi:hypothetical protein
MSEEVMACEQCGATIYPEHLGNDKAGYWSGKLYCVHCFTEHRVSQVTIDPDEFGTPSSEPEAQPPAAEGTALFDDMVPDEAMSLDESDLDNPRDRDNAISISHLQTSASSFGGFGDQPATDQAYRRPLRDDGTGATRCRIFHAKLNDGALKFIQDQINDWVDGASDISIKHVSTQVGIVEGKNSEPHLIITLFY